MTLPPPDSYACYKERVRCLCALHDCSTTSGIRTKKRSGLVGSTSPLSKHKGELGGWADDLVADDMSEGKRKKIVRDAKTLGLYVEDEVDHVHIQGLPPGPLENTARRA